MCFIPGYIVCLPRRYASKSGPLYTVGSDSNSEINFNNDIDVENNDNSNFSEIEYQKSLHQQCNIPDHNSSSEQFFNFHDSSSNYESLGNNEFQNIAVVNSGIEQNNPVCFSQEAPCNNNPNITTVNSKCSSRPFSMVELLLWLLLFFMFFSHLYIYSYKEGDERVSSHITSLERQLHAVQDSKRRQYDNMLAQLHKSEKQNEQLKKKLKEVVKTTELAQYI